MLNLAWIEGAGRGRRAADVLAFSAEQLEEAHVDPQWLFSPPPAGTLSLVPQSDRAGDQGDSGCSLAWTTLIRAAERILRFYGNTRRRLSWQVHNHLQIPHNIRSLKLLANPAVA